jgi:hypothetical protein
LLLENSTTPAVMVWQMDGTTIAANRQIGTITAGWHMLT